MCASENHHRDTVSNQDENCHVVPLEKPLDQRALASQEEVSDDQET